jgi:hypothetical protein
MRVDNLPSTVSYQSTCQVPVCFSMDISVLLICAVENKSPQVCKDQLEQEVLERINNTSNAPMYTALLQRNTNQNFTIQCSLMCFISVLLSTCKSTALFESLLCLLAFLIRVV